MSTIHVNTISASPCTAARRYSILCERANQTPPKASAAAVPPVAAAWAMAISCIHCTYSTLFTCRFASMASGDTTNSQR
jgi:hypothetical protein